MPMIRYRRGLGQQVMCGTDINGAPIYGTVLANGALSCPNIAGIPYNPAAPPPPPVVTPVVASSIPPVTVAAPPLPTPPVVNSVPATVSLQTAPSPPAPDPTQVPPPQCITILVNGRQRQSCDPTDLANAIAGGAEVLRADGSAATIQQLRAPGWPSNVYLVDGNPLNVILGQGWYPGQQALVSSLVSQGAVNPPTLSSAPTIPPAASSAAGTPAPARAAGSPSVTVTASGSGLTQNDMLIGAAIVGLWLWSRRRG